MNLSLFDLIEPPAEPAPTRVAPLLDPSSAFERDMPVRGKDGRVGTVMLPANAATGRVCVRWSAGELWTFHEPSELEPLVDFRRGAFVAPPPRPHKHEFAPTLTMWPGETLVRHTWTCACGEVRGRA